MSRYRAHENRHASRDGRIVLDRCDTTFLHEMTLLDKQLKAENLGRKHRISESASADWLLNADFHSPSSTSPMPDTISLNAQPIQATPTISLVEYSMPERSFHQERLAECRMELEQLCNQLKVKYSTSLTREASDVQSTVPPNWKFTGSLVAHLHEHKSSVTRMTSLKAGGPLFASTSTDGTVRLWD